MKRKIKEIMTKNVHVVPPECTVQQAAQKMRALDAGFLPICEGQRLIGTITDRDIVLRLLANASDLSARTVREAMTSPVIYCYEDQDIEDAAYQMEMHKVRRLIVLDRNKKLAGVVSLGDLAVKTGRENLAGEIVEKISEPSVVTQNQEAS